MDPKQHSFALKLLLLNYPLKFLVLVIEGNTDDGMVVNKISMYGVKTENGWHSVDLIEVGNSLDDLKNTILYECKEEFLGIKDRYFSTKQQEN